MVLIYYSAKFTQDLVAQLVVSAKQSSYSLSLVYLGPSATTKPTESYFL